MGTGIGTGKLTLFKRCWGKNNWCGRKGNIVFCNGWGGWFWGSWATVFSGSWFCCETMALYMLFPNRSCCSLGFWLLRGETARALFCCCIWSSPLSWKIGCCDDWSCCCCCCCCTIILGWFCWGKRTPLTFKLTLSPPDTANHCVSGGTNPVTDPDPVPCIWTNGWAWEGAVELDPAGAGTAKGLLMTYALSTACRMDWSTSAFTGIFVL